MMRLVVEEDEDEDEDVAVVSIADAERSRGKLKIAQSIVEVCFAMPQAEQCLLLEAYWKRE